MCKGCQYLIEACYWHLIEKRFCYDESIALYEEPYTSEKANHSFENMAFYDQVSIIAGRAIVTIDPLPSKPRPIEHQPLRRVRWWEDNVDEQNKQNEAKNYQNPFCSAIPTIMESSREDLTSSTEELVSINNVRKINNRSVSITTSEISDSNHETTTSTDCVDSSDSKNIVKNQEDKENKNPVEDDATRNEEKEKAKEKEKSPPRKLSSDFLKIPEQVKLRKKSLRERRMSRSLTLNIDRTLELPIIRQGSMPKFYLDTPEINQMDSSVLMTPSLTLMSPIMPRSSQHDYFDLRSVVQLENEHRAQSLVPVHKQQNPGSRLSLIKDKLKSTKIKRQGSATNLPNSIQHI